jgi:hypothetical protein
MKSEMIILSYVHGVLMQEVRSNYVEMWEIFFSEKNEKKIPTVSLDNVYSDTNLLRRKTTFANPHERLDVFSVCMYSLTAWQVLRRYSESQFAESSFYWTVFL